MQSTFGFGIADLEADGWGQDGVYGDSVQTLHGYMDSELGVNEGLNLAGIINAIVSGGNKFGDAGKEYQASFSFQNGTLTDTRVGSGTTKTDVDSTTEKATETADTLNKALTNQKSATDDFKNAAMSALGFTNQAFGLKFDNGTFSLGNTSLLNRNDQNSVSSLVGMLNGNTGTDDLMLSTQTLRNLLAARTVNIDF